MEETSNPQQAPGAFVDTRPSWDEYFMKLAEEVATRTTCLRRAVGAVVVKDRRILATGYNGVPTGLRHCAETGCLRQQLGVPSGQRHEICRGLHAEQNALLQAARYGINIEGSSIYINTQPCAPKCSSMRASKRLFTRTLIPTNLPWSSSKNRASRCAYSTQNNLNAFISPLTPESSILSELIPEPFRVGLCFKRLRSV